MGPAERIRVEVIWCPAPHDLRRVSLTLPVGTTVSQAIEASRLLENLPERSDDLPVGVWGRAAAPDAVLRDADRVEIYRPLKVDPKDARRRRQGRKAGVTPARGMKA